MAAAAIRVRGWEYQPLPTQRKFHADLRTRYKGFSGPIGSGKTRAFAYEAIFAAQLNAGLAGLVGAPTFPMLRDATQRTMFDVLDLEGIGYSFHKSENRMVLTDHGSTIYFRSLDDFERLRGTNLAWFGVDELTYCKKEAWLRLEGRLRDKRARRPEGFAAWTPKGFDFVHEMFISKVRNDDGTLKFPDHHAYLAIPRENHHLGQGFYDRLATTYDARFYQQEVLGEYLNVNSGQAYYAFENPDRNAPHPNIKPLGFIAEDTLCWSLDFNISPMSSVIAQIQNAGWHPHRLMNAQIVNVLDEIVLMNSSVWKACEAFEQKTKEWARRAGVLNVRVYGDASGGSRQHATGASCYQMIKEFFSRRSEYRVSYHNKLANPPVRDRVNAMNAKICSAEGVRTLFMDPKCKQLKRDLEQVTWKLDANKAMTGELDQKDGLTHISDALGYLVETEFGLHQKGGPRGTSPLFNN